MVGLLIILSILIVLIGAFLLWLGYDGKSKKMRTFGYAVVVLGIIAIIGSIIFYYTGTESGKRKVKDWKSDTNGGITRSVEVYDQAGNLIKTYEGKLDVQNNEYGNKVLFDLDGKRTIIYNATVIVQEK